MRDFVVWHPDGIYRAYNFLEKRYNQAYEFVELVGSIVYLGLKKIPKSLLLLNSNFGIFDLFFVGPRLARTMTPLFTKSTLEERIFATLHAVSEVNGALLQFAFARELLTAANSALLQRINTFLYPLDLILTGRTIYDLYKANSLRKQLIAICEDGNITKAKSFIGENRLTLERSCSLPKNFHKVVNTKQLEELCRHLNQRMIFAVMNQVVQCATTAFTFACYIPAVCPLMLLGYSVSGIAHAVLQITEKLVVKKNPLIFNGRQQ